MVTADLLRLRRFYAETLGFVADGPELPIGLEEMALLDLGGTGVRQTMRLGAETMAIDCFAEPGRPYPGGNAASSWFQHLAIVTTDMVAAYGRFDRRPGCPIWSCSATACPARQQARRCAPTMLPPHGSCGTATRPICCATRMATCCNSTLRMGFSHDGSHVASPGPGSTTRRAAAALLRVSWGAD